MREFIAFCMYMMIGFGVAASVGTAKSNSDFVKATVLWPSIVTAALMQQYVLPPQQETP